MHSSTVITAWDSNKLVGLIRVIDDSELAQYMHYVLVDPEYQSMGIATEMLNRVKEKYKNYLYIEVMPEDKNNVPFYKKHGSHSWKTAQQCKSATSQTRSNNPKLKILGITN